MEIQIKTYTARLCHDNGTVTLKAVATSSEQAVAIIAAAEGCPTHAVVLV
ncbi:hypothetical protein GR160_06165 [Flavobacterium sp. Sd200]|nr:hypothetical protein [Flavobacterium sp. Sd200]MXN90806.1 hypothetical protein [Flavobacterium sp. Sd200]